MNTLVVWLRRTLSDPQLVLLLVLLAAALAVLILAGRILAPLLVSAVIAYLLEGPVRVLTRLGVPRWAAAALLTLFSLGALIGLLLVLVPLLLGQAAQFARQLPALVPQVQALLLELPAEYPDLFDREQIEGFAVRLHRDVIDIGQNLLIASVALLPTIVTLVIYLGVLPLLVFFFIKDKDLILAWATGFLPTHRPLLDHVWREVSTKFGGYVRGKIYDILIVAIVSYAAFLALDLRFSALLAAITGLSTLIPYLGAPLGAVPVILVALHQWGLGPDLAWVVATYTIIQVIDGAVLGPLLLAGVVNLHPIAVFAAVLIFGHLWGFWGVFFAVPLAAVVQVVLEAWPRRPTVFASRDRVPEAAPPP